MSSEEIAKLKQTIENLQKDNTILQTKFSDLEREYDNYKENTNEKLKDLEFLNIQYEKVKLENDQLKKQLNPNDQESLKEKLDLAIEENLNLQKDHEKYIESNERSLEKKDKEIKDLKNEIQNKDKHINQITKHRDFLLSSFINSEDGEQKLKTYNSVKNFFDDSSYKTKNYSQFFPEKESRNFDNNGILATPSKKTKMDSTPFQYKYSIEGNEDEEKEFLQNQILNEIENLKKQQKMFLLNTMTTENFCFDILAEEDRNSLFAQNNNENNNTNNNRREANKLDESKILYNIDEVLKKIQQRKNKILSQKKALINKIEGKD